LFLISAGNVNENDWINYPNINSPAQDPAQSWNSISVGAYTLKDEPTLIPSQYINFQPIAKSGSLSYHLKHHYYGIANGLLKELPVCFNVSSTNLN